MKFTIREASINGAIYDKNGFPVLILDDANGDIDIDHKNKNINLSLEIDNEEGICHILGIDVAK